MVDQETEFELETIEQLMTLVRLKEVPNLSDLG
jgi:hypothetical protein